MNMGVLQPGFQDEKQKCTMKGEVKVRKGEGRGRAGGGSLRIHMVGCFIIIIIGIIIINLRV